jgi:hypothetical protein
MKLRIAKKLFLARYRGKRYCPSRCLQEKGRSIVNRALRRESRMLIGPDGFRAAIIDELYGDCTYRGDFAEGVG